MNAQEKIQKVGSHLSEVSREIAFAWKPDGNGVFTSEKERNPQPHDENCKVAVSGKPQIPET